MDLLQLLHQVPLGLQPAGRVDEDDVGAARSRRLDPVERHGPGIGAGLAAHDRDIEPPGPDLELLAGRRPEGVTRHDHRAVAFLLRAMSDLGERGGLADAVDPHDQDDFRLAGPGRTSLGRCRAAGRSAGGDRLPLAAQDPLRDLREHAAQRGRVLDLLLAYPRLEAADQLRRGGGSDVAAEEHRLEVIVELVVDLFVLREDLDDLLGHDLAGLLEPLGDLLEERLHGVSLHCRSRAAWASWS